MFIYSVAKLTRRLGHGAEFAAIAERLGDVDARDACLAIEIGKRAGDTKRPVIAACAESQGIGGLAQKRASGEVRRGDIFEQAPVAIGIGACPRMFQRGEALGLDCASRRDTGANLGTSFRGGRQQRSAAETAGTSICRSMRSSSSPEMRAW